MVEGNKRLIASETTAFTADSQWAEKSVGSSYTQQ
jgi:hypothetical protein